MKIELVLLCFSISGLLLIYFFQPQNKYVEKTLPEALEKCTGYAKITGNLVKSFVSKKGSKIGILNQGNSTAMVLLDEFYFQNQNMTIYASVSDYGGECWLFAEKVIIHD